MPSTECDRSSDSDFDHLAGVVMPPLHVALQVTRSEFSNRGNEVRDTNSDIDTDATAACTDTLPLLSVTSSTQTNAATRQQQHKLRADNSSTTAPLVLPLRLRLAQTWQRTQALWFIALAALHFSAMSVCVKVASRRHISSHEIALWRSLVAWALNYAMVRYYNVRLDVAPSYWRPLLLRSVVGTLGISLKFYAMAHMVLTDAVVIIFTSPVLTLLLGAIVLGERVDRMDVATAIVSYSGVLFVTRPSFLFPGDGDTIHSQQHATTLTLLCAHGGAIMQASSYICMRQLRDVYFCTTIHYFLLFSIGFSLATLVALGVPLQLDVPLDTLFALVMSGVCAFVGHVFLTKGLQLEQAGVASVMRYLDVVFVLLWDTLVLHEYVSLYSVVGGAIILCGAGAIVMRRARLQM